MSATARVESALRAAQAGQAAINAFTFLDHEAALRRAASIDERGMAGDGVSTLAGTPVALKDLIDHQDRVTTCGSAFYRHLASETAPCVARLEKAGAVVIGRTGLHEFAFGFSSENPHWGPVRNPWDTATSAGGSSGGSAAAVAAGITPVAVGTDTGGSVRVPAALCGTYGLKVTYDRIPLHGVFPLVASIDTVGAIADSIGGLALAYRAMSGDDTPAQPPGRLRFGVPQPWCAGAPMGDDMAQAFEDVVLRLGELGHEVHPIEMPDVSPSPRLLDAIAVEVTSVHGVFRSRGEPYGEDVARRLDEAAEVTAERAEEGRRWQEMIRSRFADAFHTVDYLVTPSVPVRRKVIGHDRIGDRHYRGVLSYFTAVVNHSLHPALALPITDSGRPPASLQVMGPMHSEPGLLGLGSSLENQGLVGFQPPPGTAT